MSSGARVSIPNSVRKMIQNIKEITGNHSEEEIYAMLKECSMDPNETAQKLLLQDTFHEVKRKRDRRKEVTMSSQISLTAEMEVQTTPAHSPSREALTISILPHTGAATMPSTEPTVVSSTIQDWLLGISTVQETVANLSIEGRVKQLTGEDQQLVDQFFNLLDQPLDDLALSHTTALTDYLEAIAPLVPQLFDPDQVQAFQNFLSEFPQHLVAINQFHAEPKTTKTQVDQVRKAVNALTEASTRSQALITQLATLSAEEAQLEAQLAHVRAQKTAVEQEQANLSQQIPNLLVQAESGPPAIKQAQARLRQNKIRYQIALQAWSRLSMYFQKD